MSLCVRLLLVVLAVANVLPAQASVDTKPLKTFDSWLAAYRRGKIDFTDAKYKPFPQVTAMLPRGILGRITPEHELQALLDAAVALDGAEAARRVLLVAATGLDKFAYTRAHAAAHVRQVGETAIVKFKTIEAKDLVLRTARGEASGAAGPQELQLALRAAALRALGAFREAAFRPTLEQQLGAAEPAVRLAAADGLLRLNAPDAVRALGQALQRERDEAALQGIVAALQQVMQEHKDKVDTQAMRAAVRAATQAFGRGSWRADLSLVEFLAKFRTAEAVPALIELLERFAQHPELVRSGQLSGLLRHRVHETLISLTGALHPIDAPQQWREFWERVKDSFQVAAEKERPLTPGTVARGFFGIPVRGTRVVFVVDVSGSMNFATHLPTGTDGKIPDKLPTRLDRAKEELIRAIEDLLPEASFNMVTFSGGHELWNKELLPASAANRKKFTAAVKKLRADGGTNTWAGLQEALKIKSFVHGARYETEVDEVFVLSDGMPSVGDVVNAHEILRLVRETNRFSKVRINTVYISGELNERDQMAVGRSGMKGEEFMQQLAEQNGGVFAQK